MLLNSSEPVVATAVLRVTTAAASPTTTPTHLHPYWTYSQHHTTWYTLAILNIVIQYFVYNEIEAYVVHREREEKVRLTIVYPHH
jgi:hypothetical protein